MPTLVRLALENPVPARGPTAKTRGFSGERGSKRWASRSSRILPVRYRPPKATSSGATSCQNPFLAFRSSCKDRHTVHLHAHHPGFLRVFQRVPIKDHQVGPLPGPESGRGQGARLRPSVVEKGPLQGNPSSHQGPARRQGPLQGLTSRTTGASEEKARASPARSRRAAIRARCRLWALFSTSSCWAKSRLKTSSLTWAKGISQGSSNAATPARARTERAGSGKVSKNWGTARAMAAGSAAASSSAKRLRAGAFRGQAYPVVRTSCPGRTQGAGSGTSTTWTQPTRLHGSPARRRAREREGRPRSSARGRPDITPPAFAPQAL